VLACPITAACVEKQEKYKTRSIDNHIRTKSPQSELTLSNETYKPSATYHYRKYRLKRLLQGFFDTAVETKKVVERITNERQLIRE
jgi:hypothetical protein